MAPPRTAAHVVRVLEGLTVAALGIYAGAMLTEGFVLVPYWRALPPEQFFKWYAEYDDRLFAFFGTLTMLMVALALATAVVSILERAPGRWFSVVAAVLAVAAVAMFPLYFEHANASFAAATLSPSELPAELLRWQRWHVVRVVLSVLALLAAVLSVRRAP
jgi:hypothetical protein